jgi:hypothetical protein
MIKLKDILKELSLDEGLTKSYPMSSAITNLKRMWDLGGKILFEIEDASIKMVIRDVIDKEELDSRLWHICNVLGYFPTHVSTPKTNFKYDYDNTVKLLGTKFAIYFDAKYDRELSYDEIPDIVYHISPSKQDTKISEMGLSPRHNDKMSTHPDRVYLTYSAKSAIGLLGNEKFTLDKDGNAIKQFTLYEIDLKPIKHQQKLRFYNDPIYEKSGIYTPDNIPPTSLTVIKQITL